MSTTKTLEMKVIEGGPRTAFLIFFISHIPITILIDGQGALSRWYPKMLTDVVSWYSHCFGDVLMKRSPSMETVWFSSVICCELIFQLPFFFVATRLLLKYPRRTSSSSVMTTAKSNQQSSRVSSSSNEEQYPVWFRTASLIYGSHVSTTLVPILATFLTCNDMTTLQKVMTISSTSTSYSKDCTELC